MSGETILIADDNRQIRMLVNASLRSGGYNLLEAEDGEAALEAALGQHPDLILLDVTMPKLDGFEVLHFLRAKPQTADTKVIMLTTAGTPADIQTGADMGVSGYIIKPFDPVQLRDAVGAVLHA
jgi:two-component system, chemotaxis family, chemotaxis protein CheY